MSFRCISGSSGNVPGSFRKAYRSFGDVSDSFRNIYEKYETIAEKFAEWIFVAEWLRDGSGKPAVGFGLWLCGGLAAYSPNQSRFVYRR